MFELALSNEELRFSLVNGSKSFVRSRARGASPTFWGRRCGGGWGRLGVRECVRNCNASDLRLEERVWRGNWGV